MTDLFAKARKRIAAVRAQHRTIRELSQLSDKALDDIGVSRSNIGYLGKMARYRVMKQF